MYFNSNLSYLRRKQCLTQDAVAETMGLSQQAIFFYESGDREPTLENLLKLSNLFGISVDDFLSKDLMPAGSMVSKNLKYLRKKENYHQEEMAGILRVSKSNMSKYENGVIELNNQGLVNVSEFFGVTVDDLLKRDLSKGGYDG